jgi:hypothetical protein
LVRRAGEVFTAPIASEPSETNVTLRFRGAPDGSIAGFDYMLSRIFELRFERDSANA